VELSLLNAVIEELTAVVPGSPVDKVVPVEHGGLALFLRSGISRPMLLLVPDQPFPRIHVISRKPEPAHRPAGFYLQVKKHIAGSRVISLGLLRGDRVVEIRCRRNTSEVNLILELTGSRTNMILTDVEGKIISVLHPQMLESGDKRPLLPGLIYSPPVQHSPDSRSPRRTTEFLSGLSSDGYLPINRSVEEWYGRALVDRQTSETRKRLEGVIRRSLAKIVRRITAIQKDMASADLAENYKQEGQLILANLGAVGRGMDMCELQDHEGKMVQIPLHPGKTPLENAELLFRKYKKARSGAALIRERLAQSVKQQEILRSLGTDLPDAPNDDLIRIESVLKKNGFGDRPVGEGRKTLSQPSDPYRVVQYGEWDILVGKSAAGNDYITMTLARPEDLWFHAEGIPGSHVLVRNPHRTVVPPEVLAKAASLAAYYSRGKGSTKVPVAYTPAKYVKKPKGAKPGMVVLVERKSVMAVPSAS